MAWTSSTSTSTSTSRLIVYSGELLHFPEPVGYGFRPTEEELVNHYLKLKLQGMHSGVVIPEIDVCKCEPWNLPALLPLIKSDHGEEWFFFSRPNYKYNNSNLRNRATEKGYWKITGKEHMIKATIGRKRILTFYMGRTPNTQKTNWVIHEYYIPADTLHNTKQDFVLCRLRKNSDESTNMGTCDDGEPSTHYAFNFESQPARGMDIPKECTQPEENLQLLFPSPQQHDFYSRDFLCANVPSNNGSQSEFGANQLDDFTEFLNSSTLFSDSSLPKSPRREYVGGVSSHTYTEVVGQAEQAAESCMVDLARKKKYSIMKLEKVYRR